MENSVPEVLLVGAGGIGSSLTDLLCPAVIASDFSMQLTLLDSDVVGLENLAFQRFGADDVGSAKVEVLANRHDRRDSGLALIAQIADLRCAEQLAGFDLVIIAVDRPEPRRLVHQSALDWLDLRCKGDGWLSLDQTVPAVVLDELTPDHRPASCQHEGALLGSNIEFGFASAAAHGCQWVWQWLRAYHGLEHIRPDPSLGRLSTGSLPFPIIKEVTIA